MAERDGASARSPITLFYSYDRKDEAFREEIETHLALLRRQGKIQGWDQREVRAGDVRQQEIDEHLNRAQIILLLISPDFLASDYCYSTEMHRALERHEAGEAMVIPLLLRPVSFEGAPFTSLQMLPTDGVPITKWGNRDDAWLDVVEELRRVIADLAQTPPPARAHDTPAPRIWHVPYQRNPFLPGGKMCSPTCEPHSPASIPARRLL